MGEAKHTVMGGSGWTTVMSPKVPIMCIFRYIGFMTGALLWTKLCTPSQIHMLKF